MLGNFVTANGAKGKQGGWLLFLALAILSVPVLLLYIKAANNRPAGQVFIQSLGVTPGIVLTVLYCVLAVMLAGDAIRLFADFIVINDLNDAGAWGNSALLTLTILLLLYCSMQSLGKAAWLIQPLVFLFPLLSICLTIGKMDLNRLRPLFTDGFAVLSKSMLSSFTACIASAFFPVFALSGSAPKRWKHYVISAGVSASLLLALVTVRDIAVLGYPAISMFRFPSFAASGTFRHSEILISSAFVLIQPFRAALCLRYAQACLKWWKPRWHRWYPPFLLSLAVLSGALSWSSEQKRWRTAGEAIFTCLLLLGPGLVVILEKAHVKKQKS